MKFTIPGGRGFVGSHLTRHLRAQGIEVETPPRGESDLRGRKLGHVIYAIGLTGNFRTKPRETVEAHVGALQRLMDGADFESWLYLSSTRVYGGLPEGMKGKESTSLDVTPGADSLYDLSKLLGEAICLGMPQRVVRIARLSNVYGPGQSQDTFLGAVLEVSRETRSVTIREAPESAKDYVSVEDVVEKLQAIATRGAERLYNVARGENVTHAALAEGLRRCGCSVSFASGAPTRIFPLIETSRLATEFGAATRQLLSDLPSLVRPSLGTDKRTIDP